MHLTLGIDLGTTNLKAGLFDSDGRLRGLGRMRVRASRDDAGRCEWTVACFWETFRAALGEALAQADATPADIRAAACASQANSFLLAGAGDGRPLTPLILWPDTRAGTPGPRVQAVWRRPDFLAQTGLGIDPGPQLAVAKWDWWQRAAPAQWTDARVFTLSDYVAHTLTGRAVVDAGTAALLGILRQAGVCWWPEALAELRLDATRLATPVRPGTAIGAVTPNGAAVSGLAAGTRLAAGGLDHQLAAIGAGLGDNQADVSVSLGTVLAVVARDTSFRPAPGLCCLPGRTPSEHHRLAFDGRGGGLLEAYRAQSAPQLSLADLDALAAAVPDDAGGLELVWPPDPSANGGMGFRNQSTRHGHGHAVRAILNASAAALVELTACAASNRRLRQVVVTGGGKASRLWRDVLAGRLGCPVVPSDCSEPACRGAARLADPGAFANEPNR